MWAHGAMELSSDGKSIAFNKPEFVEAMRRFIQAWKDGYDETGTSWDDSNNNRAFLSGQLAATLNASSIYSTAKRDFPALADDINHALIPRGPSGRFCFLETMSLGILKNSQNIAGAKEFLKWWFQDDQFNAWFRIQEGFQLPHVKKLENDPMWFKDPKMTVCREQPKYARASGHAGPPNDKAAMVFSKYIIVDTFAKAVQTGDAKAAVEWGAEQLKRAYGM
jgi:multiple sugar transport system substrate-binding protein